MLSVTKSSGVLIGVDTEGSTRGSGGTLKEKGNLGVPQGSA